MAVRVVERTERQFPALVAIHSVADESEIAEEDVDIAAVAHRRGRGGAVGLLHTLHARTRRFPLPLDFAGRAIEADREELFAFVSSEENARAGQNRRRMPGRKRCFPDGVLFRSDLDRQTSIGGDPRALRTAEVRPVTGAHVWTAHEEQDDECKPVNRHVVNCSSRGATRAQSQTPEPEGVYVAR